MKHLREFERESGLEIYGLGLDRAKWEVAMTKFAQLIVQDCANFVREDYDHEAAESIAWHMEIEYGLHGDHA